MSRSLVTSERNLPIWCAECVEHTTYTKKGDGWVCDKCGHEYYLPKRTPSEGNGWNFKSRRKK